MRPDNRSGSEAALRRIDRRLFDCRSWPSRNDANRGRAARCGQQDSSYPQDIWFGRINVTEHLRFQTRLDRRQPALQTYSRPWWRLKSNNGLDTVRWLCTAGQQQPPEITFPAQSRAAEPWGQADMRASAALCWAP